MNSARELEPAVEPLLEPVAGALLLPELEVAGPSVATGAGTVGAT